MHALFSLGFTAETGSVGSVGQQGPNHQHGRSVVDDASDPVLLQNDRRSPERNSCRFRSLHETFFDSGYLLFLWVWVSEVKTWKEDLLNSNS